jgi:hypothetical protein
MVGLPGRGLSLGVCHARPLVLKGLEINWLVPLFDLHGQYEAAFPSCERE